MPLPDLSNSRLRNLANFSGILLGTGLAYSMEGVASAAGAGLATLLSNVAAADAATKWEDRTREPKYAHSNHDLTLLIGRAIARVLYQCGDDAESKRAALWFRSLAKISEEKYLAVCSHPSLRQIDNGRLPELFASASAAGDSQKMKLLTEEVLVGGEPRTIAFALVDYLRSEAGQKAVGAYLKNAEERLIKNLFSAIREMFKRAWEGKDRAFAALCLDVWSQCLDNLASIQRHQSEAIASLGLQAGQLDAIRGTLFEQRRRIDQQHGKTTEMLESVLVKLSAISELDEVSRGTRYLLDVEDAVSQRIANQQAEYVDDPRSYSAYLATAAVDALTSRERGVSNSDKSEVQRVLAYLQEQATRYDTAARELDSVAVKARMRAANWAHMIGDVDAAIESVDAILDRDPHLSPALQFRARLYLSKREYKDATECFKRAIANAVTVNERAYAEYGIAFSWYNRRQWKKSIRHFQNARDLAHENNRALDLQACAYMAAAFHERKQRREAAGCLEDAIRLGTELRDREETAECYCHLGMVYQELNDLVTAERMYRRSLEWWKTKGDIPHIGNELRNVGNICLQQEKYEEAGHCLSDAVYYLEVAKDHLLLASVKEKLATIAAKRDDWVTALIHARNSTEEWERAGEVRHAQRIRAWSESIQSYIESNSSGSDLAED